MKYGRRRRGREEGREGARVAEEEGGRVRGMKGKSVGGSGGGV